jgi:hypothetical protein
VIVRAGRPSAHALALAGVAALLLAAGAFLSPDSPPLSLIGCPFRAATGIPCLGCGATHAFHFAARGQLVEAFFSSPLATLCALACAVHVAWTALRLAGVPFAPRMAITPALRWTAAAALAANWLFVALWGHG